MLDGIFLVFGKHYSFSVILRNCCSDNLCNYHFVSFKGEKCLCPIFLSSRTDDNGSKSRTRRRGWFYFGFSL